MQSFFRYLYSSNKTWIWEIGNIYLHYLLIFGVRAVQIFNEFMERICDDYNANQMLDKWFLPEVHQKLVFVNACLLLDHTSTNYCKIIQAVLRRFVANTNSGVGLYTLPFVFLQLPSFVPWKLRQSSHQIKFTSTAKIFIPALKRMFVPLRDNPLERTLSNPYKLKGGFGWFGFVRMRLCVVRLPNSHGVLEK